MSATPPAPRWAELPRADLVQLCRRLIQTPSVNGEHPEQAVAELVAAFAAGHGLPAEILAAEPGRANVLVRAGPDRPADLLLVAHLDTVPAGDATAWLYPPFSGHLAGGKIYGRGAADTKGGLTAALAALLLVQQLPADERPAVLLVGVPDEESGATGRLGIRHLHALGRLSGRGAIYCYPGSDTLVIGHRGVLRLTLRAGGTALHTGGKGWQNGPPGHNAVTGMAEALLALEALRFHTAGTGLFAPFRTVITPTVVRGGSGVSMVPGTCAAQVDVRLVPDVPREAVLAAVRAALGDVAARRPPLRLELAEDVYLPPTIIPQDAPVVLAAQAAAHEVLGRTPQVGVSGPANESYLLNALGIPTCIIGPEGGNVHAADEHVAADSILEAAAIYARVAQLLAAGRPQNHS